MKYVNQSQRKLCLECKYVLDELPSATCPECGRSFNAEDSNTFQLEGISRVNNPQIVVAIYVAPHVFVFLPFMMLLGLLGWSGLAQLWIMASYGPLILFINWIEKPVVVQLFLWSTFLATIYGTRFRNVSYLLHTAIAVVWPITGWCLYYFFLRS